MRSIISNIKTIFARRTAPVPDETPSFHQWPARSEAAIYINETTASGVSTAWACGSLISKAIAQLPVHVMIPRGDSDLDGADRVMNHPIGDLLDRAANEEMSAFSFKARLLLTSIFHGNGYAEISRDGVGRANGLFQIHPDRVAPMRDGDGKLYFTIDNGVRGKVDIPAADMLHLPALSFEGPVGMSLISQARHSLGLAVSQERQASALAANGGQPSGVLMVKGAQSEDGKARQKVDIDRLIKGPRNTGRIITSYAGEYDWKQIAMKSVDAEFMAQRRFGVEEICRWFAVPPQLVSDTSKQTFANYSEAKKAFLDFTLMPWIVSLEAECSRKLIRRERTGQTPYVQVQTRSLARADETQRFQNYALARQWGIYSTNDCRRLEGMPPIDGGDEYATSPGNAAPADDATRQQASAPLLRFPSRER